MENQWHDIPGYEWLYQFNWHTNQVKSLRRQVRTFYWNRIIKESILKLDVSSGRVSVCLSKNNRLSTISLWRLTLLITKWPKPKWLMCCHNDWNPWNNLPENVRYDTAKANWEDSVRHGTMKMAWWLYRRKKILRSDWKIFESMKEAVLSLWKSETSSSNISAVCRWKRRIALGYGWEYIS